MPLNIPGTLVPLHLLINPRLVLPSVVVKGQCSSGHFPCPTHRAEDDLQEDIRQLNFAELRKAGYKGAVFDKDNCLVRTTFLFIHYSSLTDI